MWRCDYGNFDDNQVAVVKKYMRKRIYFLLICVDRNTCEDYKDINVNQAFESLLDVFGGLNEILHRPAELVIIMSMLKRAQEEYNREDFNFGKYRSLLLGAGNEVLKIAEV